jgi:hypothetical protein
MLTKALEERYQSAQDVARDLRECERQINAPLTATSPPRPSTLASGLEPELVDTNAKTAVMAQTLNRTRQADKAPEEVSTPPTHGLAHSFDSMEATQRLATLTGATTTLGERGDERQTATQALGSMQRPSRPGWRRRDWLLVGGAAVLGAVVARLVAKRRDR